MLLRKSLLRTLKPRNNFTNVALLTTNEQKYRDSNNGDWKNKIYSRIGVGTALLSAAIIGTNITDKIDNKKNIPNKKFSGKVKNVENLREAGQRKPGLPTYRAEEVAKHDTEKSFWVIYKEGVYDMTEFLPTHPGGELILNAGGLSIEPFWNIYGMHKTQQVYDVLESYRIGNLHADDVVEYPDDDLWAAEPERDKRLVVKTPRPFNAETPPRHLVEHFDTPNELFFVRHHMAVPELSADSHKLTVTVVGGDTETSQFSLQDLGRFRRATVRAALMCAGNRRSEINKQVTEKSVKGIDWGGGAVGNAVWSGVYLRDVLLHCGVDVHNTDGKHVILSGSDTDAEGNKFNTSIPLSMAVSPGGRVLLATHMNGAPLAPDHGYPLRALVPGAPAVRSVKWLESITVSEEESSSHVHQHDYRSFNASTTWQTADFPAAPPLYSLPVTSYICCATPGDGRVHVRGYAYSGGGARVERVDVSGDGGATWVSAQAVAADPAPPHQHYSWLLWTADVPVPSGRREVELWAKATDSNFNTQPERFHHIWNIRGLLGNAYHRVTVKMDS